MAPRNRLADLTRSLPYVAVRQGARMARLMLATLDGEANAAAPRHSGGCEAAGLCRP